MLLPLSEVGEDAFTKGFLNQNFANAAIGMINLLTRIEVKMPIGWGAAKVMVSKENIVIDLSGALPQALQLYITWNGSLVLVNLLGNFAPT